jgi:hypothetical protein
MPVDPTAKLPLKRSDHYAQLAKQGITDPLSVIPEFPSQCLYIWEWFNELRHVCGDELNPSNMLAFFTLKQVTPKPYEVTALNELYVALQTVQASA